MEKVFHGSANLTRISAYSFLRLAILLALLQTFIVESIQREGMIAALYWISAHFHLFLINALLVLILNLLFVSIFGSFRVMFLISTIILVLLSTINLVKKQFLGEPLLPWDLLRVDQVVNLLPKISGQIGWILIFLVVILFMVFLISRFVIPSYSLNWVSRLVFLVSAMVIIPLFVFYRHTPLQTAFQKADIAHIFWVQSENSLVNGFLFGFIMNLEDTMIFQPDGYSRERIGEIIENVKQTRLDDLQLNTMDKKPNVVLVINEAFWDPLKLPGVTFSQDPIPYFRELGSESFTGTMVSPVFGGSTANVEFEILTGLSTCFLPQGSIAYQQYIQQPIPSIVEHLKKDGYVTTAIHPYYDWFYKRDKIYPLLGFDHFLSLDDFKDPVINGEYIADLEVSEKIVEQIHKTQEPSFVLAITMQNHGPYPENRYEKNRISLTGSLSPQGEVMLETYAQGLKDADDALLYLVDRLRESTEPTVLIFLGDHLPFLGKDYQVYKETGYIRENENKWSKEETLNMKSVPFVIWSNYSTTETTEPTETQTISAQYLGLKILDQVQIPDNAVFGFVRDFAEKSPVYNQTLRLDSENVPIQKENPSFKASEQEYQQLLYDILFGKQYFREFSG